MKKLRTWVPAVLAVAIVVFLATAWWQSRLPGTYSVTEMGYADYGGGPRSSHGAHAGTSVTDLVADPGRQADVAIDLTARQGRFRLASGEEVDDGYTLNGTSPGPTIRVRQGQLLEVRLRNENVADGAALHWHGVDVPNAEDGVAGVTQDAVPPGGTYTYRFPADQVGTYWFHSHQVSHLQVRRGLFGVLVVEPRTGSLRDALAVAHVYGGTPTVNGRSRTDTVAARPGEKVRVRVVNTDNGSLHAWVSGSPYRLLAVDGYDVSGPTPVTDRSVLVTAGGRVDLEVTAPARVELGATALVVGSDVPRTAKPAKALDLLGYGAPAALPFDPEQADRRFRYYIGRRPGFVDGKPGLWWSINSNLFPDVPMFHVAEGDVVRMTIRNRSFDTHPMHLHGHHAVVLSRDGVRATGSPWWVDSLEVEHGETYEIAFLADNPGIWMDHCHNLPHAKEGLVAHLMYEGVTTPFEVGGKERNRPE